MTDPYTPDDPRAAGSVNESAEGEGTDSVVEQQGDAAPRRDTDAERDKYLRLAAEYDNFRKRATRERDEARHRAQGDLVLGLLDALDDLTRFAHLDPASTDARTVVEGAEMVERKLLKSLSGHGLEIIDPVDHPFDPNVHEAVQTEPALSPEDDHLVSRVFQRGYTFNGRLLRPARVLVKQWRESAT
jgi:molecular chaperone GrpE